MMVPECFAFTLENMHPEKDVALGQRPHLIDIKTHCLVKQWRHDLAVLHQRGLADVA